MTPQADSRRAPAPSEAATPGQLARFWPDMQSSPTPMLLANDDREYVEANAAACQLIGLQRDEVLSLRVDDLAAPELRHAIGATWGDFLRVGWMGGTYELCLPDSRRLEVEYAATANIVPGLHLSVLHAHRPGVSHRRSASRTLTPRERDVLRMIAMGADTDDIAEQLVIGRETVRTHVRHAVLKLGARNRPHALALAFSRGLIDLPSQTTAAVESE